MEEVQDNLMNKIKNVVSQDYILSMMKILDNFKKDSIKMIY
jgi:hypothetical protein